MVLIYRELPGVTWTLISHSLITDILIIPSVGLLGQLLQVVLAILRQLIHETPGAHSVEQLLALLRAAHNKVMD